MCPILPPGGNENISVFLERVFQECLTYEGEMDYKTYLDFVLAIENKREPAALQYLFRLLDIQGKNYLTRFDLNYFFRAIQQVNYFLIIRFYQRAQVGSVLKTPSERFSILTTVGYGFQNLLV